MEEWLRMAQEKQEKMRLKDEQKTFANSGYNTQHLQSISRSRTDVSNKNFETRLKSKVTSDVSSTEKHRGSSPVTFSSAIYPLEIFQGNSVTTPSPTTTQESGEDKHHGHSSSSVNIQRNGAPSHFFNEDLFAHSASIFIDQLVVNIQAPRRVEMVAHYLLHQLTHHKEISFR